MHKINIVKYLEPISNQLILSNLCIQIYVSVILTAFLSLSDLISSMVCRMSEHVDLKTSTSFSGDLVSTSASSE